MTDQAKKHPDAYVKRKKGISAVWLVPTIALIFGGWLLLKAISEQGTFITVQFDDAKGIVAGKTAVRYKGLTVGKVTNINVSEDLQSVVVKIEMVASSKDMLTDKTLFWPVTADVSFKGISELDTLFSGSYINIKPDFTLEGESQRHFVALKEAPILDQSTPGLHLTLHTENLGSLGKGSPVTFKQITVGHVSGFRYSQNNSQVEVNLFIEPEYAHLVRENTRFWNASGFEITGSLTSGVQVKTASLSSIISGGVAFADPSFGELLPEAKNGQQYTLYSNFQTAEMGHEIELELNWDSGIDDGALIRYQGLTLGKIVSLKKIDPQNRKIIALAKVNPRVSPYLTTETQFYVVSPQVSLGGITNMHSLMIGAHIGVRPSVEGDSTKTFIVYNQQPAYKYNEPGLHLVLSATNFTSLKINTGVFYKQQQVGTIQAIEQLDADNALVHIHIEENYKSYVTSTSRFWNSSGISVTGGLQGFKLQAQSIQSILSGGIEFDRGENEHPVKNGDTFALATNKQTAKQSTVFKLYTATAKGLSKKTRIMYKGEQIGSIHQIDRAQDEITLEIGILPNYQFLLKEKTQFWLVRPKLSLAGISDSEAIFGGAYINVDAGEGKATSTFDLSLAPPAKHASAKGLQLSLITKRSSSLSTGSVVSYKGITVGQVDNIELHKSGEEVTVNLTIDEEYRHLVSNYSRFYNASGINISGGVGNLMVKTESIDTMLQGGISFYDSESHTSTEKNAQLVAEGSRFSLFDDIKHAQVAGLAVTIHFNDIAGLKENTQIKYQDHLIGIIERVSFDQNGFGATVYAYLKDHAKHFAVSGTKFWLAKPQLGLVGSSNVSALIEGNFIQVLPGDGAKQISFNAEDLPPAISQLSYGLNIKLSAEKLGSIRVGNPVMYRQVVVGKVIGVDLSDRADQVNIYLNIAQRYAPLITQQSKFWNVSGFELDIGLISGLNIESESIETLLAGGIAFATPEQMNTDKDPAEKKHEFNLHDKPQQEWLSWQPKIELY